jgi:hypothetical protein
MKYAGYSLLEILLVTALVIIFIVVINPGTYMDHFSKLLVKMAALNEANGVANKLNTVAFEPCQPLTADMQSFTYAVGNNSFHVFFEDDSLKLSRVDAPLTAVMYRYVDPAVSPEFLYWNRYMQPESQESAIELITLQWQSSLMGDPVQMVMLCRNSVIQLGYY